MDERILFHSPRLASGRWKQVGRIAFLASAPLPRHLESTVVARELDGRSAAIRDFEVRGSGPCSAIIDSGVTVLFDPRSGTFLRHSGRGSFDDVYLDLRRRFQLHVPGPSFTVEEDGALLVEQALEGDTLAALDEEGRLRLVHGLARRFCALVESDVEPLSDTRRKVLVEILSALESAPLSAQVLSSVDRALLINLLVVDTAAPAKGPALGENNLIVVDGKLHCIDFPRMAMLPRWSDPFTLLVHTGSETMRSERYADEIARVLDAAGVQHRYLGTAMERAAVVLATIATERLRLDRSDPIREAATRGVANVVERSLRELERDWSDLLAL